MKTVLITGATSGIGEALVAQYHQCGFMVLACGRNQEKLNILEQRFEHVKACAFDITDTQQINAVAEHIEDIDIMILNAGDCLYIDDVMSFDASVFEQVIKTNLVSMGYMLEAFLSKVLRGGQLVFVSSSATLLPFQRAQAYGASKAGVDYLADSLRVDLLTHGIDVTLVHPGFIKTPLTDKNTFDMPFMLSAKQAAKAIFKGVQQRKDYLQFPKRLTYLLRFIALMPRHLWHAIAIRSTH